jgi:hypothetical protein
MLRLSGGGKKPDGRRSTHHEQDFTLRLLEKPAISFTPPTRS